MLFKVELRTDDPELVKILCEVRKRAKFVKKALKHYISTKRGKETFRVMSTQDIEDTGKVKKTDAQKLEKPVHNISGSGKKSVYDLDRFL